MPDDSHGPIPSSVFDSDRYRVHSRLEIIAILRALIAHSSLITAYYGTRDEFVVTALLAVNPDFEELIFDCGADPRANERLLRAAELKLTTQLDHIRIQFIANRVEATVYQDRPAFRMRLPETLSRLQRRESYRIKVPLSQRVTCDMPLEEGKAQPRITVRVFDLSCGGIALYDYPTATKFTPGAIHARSCIDLPDAGVVIADLEIIHVLEITTRTETRSRRCGCRFVNLPNAMAVLIQRYINRIEREQLIRG